MSEAMTAMPAARDREAEAAILVASAREYVRGLEYTPMTDEDVAAAEEGMKRANHENDMEFIRRPAWRAGLDAMILEERVPASLWREVSNRLLAEFAAMHAR